MREHIYDSSNNFYKFYNPFNTIGLSAQNKYTYTSFAPFYYDNIYKYYNIKYNTILPIDYTDLKTIYNSIKSRQDNYGVYDYIRKNTYFPTFTYSYIIISKSYLYIVLSYSKYLPQYTQYDYIGGIRYIVGSSPASTTYHNIVNRVNISTKTYDTVKYVGDSKELLEYSLDNNNEECYFYFQSTVTNQTNKPHFVKYSSDSSVNISTNITVNGALSMDGNSSHLFVMSTSSSTTNYVPMLTIVEKTSQSIIKNITFPTVAIASFGYHICCNESKLFLLDATNRVIKVYMISDLINGVINQITSINGVYDNPLVMASSNVNRAYFSKINVDEDDNIYVGDYSKTLYDFEQVYSTVQTHIFPSKVSSDGSLLRQQVLPHTFIYPSNSYYVGSYGYKIIEGEVYNGLLNKTTAVASSISPNNISELLTVPYIYEDEKGKLTLNGNGTVDLKHNGVMPTDGSAKWVTNSKVTYRHLESDFPLKIPFNITDVNDVPILDIIEDKITDEDTPIDITLNYSDEETSMSNLLLDVTSYDASMLYYSISGPTLRLIPVRDKFGSTIVSVRVRDPLGASISRSFTLTVRPVNDRPVTTDITSIVNEENILVLDLKNNTIDVDDLNLTYHIVDYPTNGNVVISNSIATYTPNPNYFGVDSFTFKSNDSLVDSNVSTCNITVKPVNDKPVFTSTISDLYTSQSTPLIVRLTATDVDSSNLTFRASGYGVIGSNDNRNGTLTINVGNTVGSGNINIDVYDDQGLYDRIVVKLTIGRRWGDGKLTKITPNKLNLTSLNYVLSVIDLDTNKLNEVYKNESNLSSYYTVNAQKTYVVTDYVNELNEDVLNFMKNNFVETINLNDITTNNFSMVLDKLSNSIEFETNYVFGVGEESYDVNTYEKINVSVIKFNSNSFFQVDSIVYNINGNEVVFENKTLIKTKRDNTFSKTNYGIYEKEDGIAYLHRLF